MSDLNREDFEIWVKKRSASSPSGFYPQLLFRCALEPERYMISWVDSAFEGWQASRECLVIDTRPIRIEADCHVEAGVESVFYAAIDAIHAAGVKTK